MNALPVPLGNLFDRNRLAVVETLQFGTADFLEKANLLFGLDALANRIDA